MRAGLRNPVKVEVKVRALPAPAAKGATAAAGAGKTKVQATPSSLRNHVMICEEHDKLPQLVNFLRGCIAAKEKVCGYGRLRAVTGGYGRCAGTGGRCYGTGTPARGATTVLAVSPAPGGGVGRAFCSVILASSISDLSPIYLRSISDPTAGRVVL